MTDDELNEQMAEAMASGDWAAAEHIGELLDSRFYDGEGNRIDPADPFNDATFEWFEAQDRDTQDRFVEQMGDAWEHFGPAQYAHMHGGRTSQLPTVREMRREFEDWLDVEWIKAEEATNGNMLTHEATAAGVTIKQLWKVNANTARAWASEELLDYWNSAGRMTFADWQASYTGGESTSTLMAGAWR